MSKNLEIKTYDGWKEGSIYNYLVVGDIVDEKMYEHFLNILPPLTYSSTILQVREAYDFYEEGGVYLTFEKVNGNWVYRGHCYKNRTENMVKF